MRYFYVQIGIVLCVLLSVSVHADAQLNEAFKLTASDTAAIDRFGWSVGLSGTTTVIGSIWDDDAGNISGSAYLFDTTTGSQLLKLTASDAAAGDQFGTSVAINGATTLVGANWDDDAGGQSGSAYLFNTNTGNELFKLTASDAAAGDEFGYAMSISGNTAIIGARVGDSLLAADSGSAYLFNTTTGSELLKLTAADAAAGDEFGYAMSLSGNTAIVGARFDDDAGSSSGSAYLFDITTGNELFKLTASDAAVGDQFGSAVAISGNIAIVGSLADDDAGTNSGSAYVFDVTTGNELFKLTASDAGLGDLFGLSVAINGNIAIIGSILDDDGGSESGSAYLFDVTTGNELSKLTASDAAAGDTFGFFVAINSDTAVIGSRFDNNGAGIQSGSAYVFDVVPEPATLSLLALGGVRMITRNSRRLTQ